MVTACWRFPEVTLLVATTFSPCPLAQEWKHRILRSPPDTGAGGNLSRRTLLTSGGLCGRPGADCGASDQEPCCTPSPLLDRYSLLPASVAASSHVICRTDSCRCHGAVSHRHTATTVPTGRRLAQRPVTFRYQAATTAPGGPSPWATSRPKAIRSFRARATMPSLRRRTLP